MATDSTTTVKEVSRKARVDWDVTAEELQHALDDMRAEPKELAKPAADAGFSVKDLAEQYKIPPGMILAIAGKPYVTKEGLLVQARRIGFDRIEAEILEDGHGGYQATGRVYRSLRPEETHLLETMVGHDREAFLKVYMDLHAPTVAHATATPANVKMAAMHPYMRELAETRAINRALRLFTGCGLVSVDELEDPGASA